MESTEKTIWEEKAGLKDFYVNPVLWLLTICTLGIYLLITYLIRINSRYTLTNERLIKESGILSKSRDEIELFRVKDTAVKSTLLQRFVGYGNISVVSSDATGNFILENLPDAMAKREQIRMMSNKAREIKGVRTIINE
jgi:uncharacterized membrane protein YdbT with pleckstrin-like domain